MYIAFLKTVDHMEIKNEKVGDVAIEIETKIIIWQPNVI
jgi:hypothetical protein